MPIIMHQFVRPSVDYWLQEAQKHKDNEEPVISFICAWIAFNYCYSLFWTKCTQTDERPAQKSPVSLPFWFRLLAVY